jgi:hypothetical protein
MVSRGRDYYVELGGRWPHDAPPGRPCCWRSEPPVQRPFPGWGWSAG